MIRRARRIDKMAILNPVRDDILIGRGKNQNETPVGVTYFFSCSTVEMEI